MRWERAHLSGPVRRGSQMSSQRAVCLLAQNPVNERSHPRFGSECVSYSMVLIKRKIYVNAPDHQPAADLKSNAA